MVWIAGTDYPPAQQHVGFATTIATGDIDVGTAPVRDEAAVIGWRSACECGWRGDQFYSRADWPSRTGAVPEAVDGWEDVTAACSEWTRHLTSTLPELSVYQLARELAETRTNLTAAVSAARRAGVSWTRIADAAGVSAERATQRWGQTGAGPDRSATPQRNRQAPRPDAGPTR